MTAPLPSTSTLAGNDINEAADVSFPAVRTRAELAAWLGLSDKRLRFLLYGRTEDVNYTVFSISKRSGGTRQIAAPTPILAAIQRKIAAQLSLLAPVRHIAKGYVRGASIADHAALHANRRWVVCADIEGFFPSINFGRVLGMFRSAPFVFPEEVAVPLAQLCCFKGVLPQGAPTSPVISNVICRSLDRKLLELAKPLRCVVSRYADDICFSTNLKEIPSAIATRDGEGFSPGAGLVDALVSSGFDLNPKKFSVKRGSSHPMITGLIVTDVPRMPRRWRRELRMTLHVLRKYGEEEAAKAIADNRKKRLDVGEVNALSVIRGRSAFASYLDRRFGTGYVESLIRGYPQQSELLGSRSFAKINVITEGKTDRFYLESAYRELADKLPDLRRLVVSFSDKPLRENGFGDESLKRHLEEISGHDLPMVTVGLFDCDNSKILSSLGIGPGEVKWLGSSVAAACLPRPEIQDGAYCIEHFIPAEVRSQFSVDGRRIFSIDEFDGVNGMHTSGAFYRTIPKKTSLIVDADVYDTRTGLGVALSKSDFCSLICSATPPFDGFDWGCFRRVLEMIAKIARRELPERL